MTWAIFSVWLLIVLAFYFAWGRRHALLNDPEHRARGRRSARAS